MHIFISCLFHQNVSSLRARAPFWFCSRRGRQHPAQHQSHSKCSANTCRVCGSPQFPIWQDRFVAFSLRRAVPFLCRFSPSFLMAGPRSSSSAMLCPPCVPSNCSFNSVSRIPLPKSLPPRFPQRLLATSHALVFLCNKQRLSAL